MSISGHYIVFAILGALLVLFIWGRWRYDIVALAGLIAAVLAGIVPSNEAFMGFAHPATITVAAVLVVSRALFLSGAADTVADKVLPLARGLLSHIAVLSGVASVFSGFMNNVGALGLLMPVALQSAAKAGRSPARILMPLSFASILGGLLTLIGTPPNIIIATFREDVVGAPFRMFDFTPVGAAVAVAGILFVVFVGWRLIPVRDDQNKKGRDLFHVEEYVAEARVPKNSPAVGKTLAQVEDELAEGIDALVVGVVRRGRASAAIRRNTEIRSSDVLLVEANPDELDKFVSAVKLKLAGTKDEKKDVRSIGDMAVLEAVVRPGARIEGRTAEMIRFRRRYGVSLLAVSRRGRPYRGRLKKFRFQAGDVLLIQGEAEHLPEVAATLGCLPLAERGLQFGKRGQAGVALAIFAAAIGVAAFGLVPISIALGAAAIGMVLAGVLPVREFYDGVDWPVIVLVGALIPVGTAMETTGASAIIASGITRLVADMPAALVVIALLVITMTLSDLLNNAATAVIMAPIAVQVAADLGVNADPFLMAVAVGASCAFLTPIGHQNNALIMGPGGYEFGDYWRMGLPLEVIIVAVAVPMILLVWPL